MDKLPHTYGWYCTHGFLPGGKVYTSSGEYANAPSDRSRSEVMKENGIFDLVPNLENFLKLVKVARDYWTEQEKKYVPFNPNVKPTNKPTVKDASIANTVAQVLASATEKKPLHWVIE